MRTSWVKKSRRIEYKGKNIHKIMVKHYTFGDRITKCIDKETVKKAYWKLESETTMKNEIDVLVLNHTWNLVNQLVTMGLLVKHIANNMINLYKSHWRQRTYVEPRKRLFILVAKWQSFIWYLIQLQKKGWSLHHMDAKIFIYAKSDIGRGIYVMTT